MEFSREEEQQGFLDRASRATRGKRMTRLLDDEIEEDEAFWNQDALREEENDEEYEEEPEAADEFDSDFDEDELEPDDDEAENDVADSERRPKKRMIFPGKQLPKKRKKKVISKLEESLNEENNKDLSKSDESSDDEKNSEQTVTPDRGDNRDVVEGERTIRKSTRTAVVVRQAERDAIRAALQATIKPIKRKKEGEEKRMTQEEMLLEAAQTEIMNLRNLERVLAREEEVKKRAIVRKPVYTGPQIRYFSKNGDSYIEFSNGASFHSDISTKSVPYPQIAVCAVTGLPAKYRDPKTGLPYATKEAYQILRQRYTDENSCRRGHMAMQSLYDSIIGQGFMGRKKRSSVPYENGASTNRYSRRFHRIPAADNLDSD